MKKILTEDLREFALHGETTKHNEFEFIETNPTMEEVFDKKFKEQECLNKYEDYEIILREKKTGLFYRGLYGYSYDGYETDFAFMGEITHKNEEELQEVEQGEVIKVQHSWTAIERNIVDKWSIARLYKMG